MKTVNYFKALSDETRLRILNLLYRHELNVNEIVHLMGMGQSRISRHLKILTDAGILSFRRDGLSIFYSLSKDKIGKDFIDRVIDFLNNDNELVSDLSRIENILKVKEDQKKLFFDSIAPDWDVIKHEIIGSTSLGKEILSRFKQCGTIADLGCGTGELLLHFKEKG